ncbi:MAG: trigger factor [Candidatus Berkelbacteria bacterium]
MSSNIEKNKSKVKLSIKVSPKELVKHFQSAYDKLAPTVKLDGFRPGKAPRPLIESTIGVSRLLSEAIDAAINEAYFMAVQEHQLSPISSPNIAVNSAPSWGLTDMEIEKDLEFVAEVDVFPEVSLKDYSKAKITLPKKDEAKQEDVDKVLKQLQRQKATYNVVDRAAKMGDLAEISFEGAIKKVRIDEMCSKNFPIVLGDSTLIPGFEEKVVGMKKGEKKEFKIKFPSTYHKKDYANKEAEFKVELLELKEVVLPVIDDKFAEDFGQKNAKSMEDAIRANLAMEMEQQYKAQVDSMVVEKMISFLQVEIPESLIEKEIDRMIHDYGHQLEGMRMTLDKYLADMKKSIEDLRKDMRAQAEKNIKIGLMLGETAKSQKFDVDDKEVGRKALNFLVEKLTK